MEITSVNNNLVKETVRLQQKKYRTEKFLLEGFKAIEGAYNSGIKFDYVFVSDKKADEYKFCVVVKNVAMPSGKLCTQIAIAVNIPALFN